MLFITQKIPATSNAQIDRIKRSGCPFTFVNLVGEFLLH